MNRCRKAAFCKYLAKSLPEPLGVDAYRSFTLSGPRALPELTEKAAASFDLRTNEPGVVEERGIPQRFGCTFKLLGHDANRAEGRPEFVRSGRRER